MDENIRALLASVITDEMIKEAVRDVIYEKMSDYNTSCLIREAANDIFKEKATGYMQNLIDEEFKKPVKKDDGWGVVEYYDSFDEFVRKEMKSKLSNNWDFRREVDRKLEKVIDNAKKRVAQKVAETDFADEVLAELNPKDFQQF
jgi:hypothetical protein